MEGKRQVAEDFHKLSQHMPREARFATAWVAKHIDLVEQLLRGCVMTSSECSLCMEQAIKQQDYKLWALFLYQQFRQEAATSR